MRTLVDAGPLVASLNRKEPDHVWAVGQLKRLAPPLLTCEAVLSEAVFLVARNGGNPVAVLDFVTAGALTVQPVLPDHVERIAELMRKYADTPMSLADACLVVLAEQQPSARVFTLDTDFLVYRAHGRRRIPLLAPFAS